MARPTDGVRRFQSFLRRKKRPDLSFFLRALREADPDFGEPTDPHGDDGMMSREWLTRRMRRAA